MNKLSDTQLKFGFKDLGPIQKKGEIKNSGLTLLYGFPNSGKSFVLRGLYGALAFSDEYQTIYSLSNWIFIRS